MTTERNELSSAQQICLSAAMVGLIGSATDVLRAAPKAEALHAFQLIAQGLASFSWSVEAHRGDATVKLELVHVDGRRQTLSLHTVSLELQPPEPPASAAPGSAYQGGLH